MDPVTSLGLASNVIQIVDFTSRLISQSCEIYQSAEGILESHALLEDAATNLSELCQELTKSGTNRQLTTLESDELSSADKLLIKLGKECERTTMKLVDVLNRVKAQSPHKKWQSVRQAIHCLWSEKDIVAHEKRLENLRSQIDTALLWSLRERIQAPPPENETHRIEAIFSSFMRDSRTWQAQLLQTLKEKNWKHDNEDHVEQFTNQLNSLLPLELEAQFCRMICARLHFPSMPDRLESIAKAYQETFEWLFRNESLSVEPYQWDSFSDWLQNATGSSIYWITGKPGSGKSTLMKYLYNDSRTATSLDRWSGGQPVIKSGFFFWNSGTAMQMSRIGLLQSILLEALRNDPAFAISLFRQRWEQFLAFGGGKSPMSWPELRRAFEAMAFDESKRFFLVIDGLDEFDGNPKELIELIIDASKHSNVKICTSSRTWMVFEESFENRPSLCLERLTYDDIHHYVTSKFRNNRHYQRLKWREPNHALKIIHNVVDKATGVFLWVYLVVDSLLEGLSNSDRMSDLQSRLDDLPSDLEALFDKMLNRLDPNYFIHACQLLRLLRNHPKPTLLELYFADDEDIYSGSRADIKVLTLQEQDDKREEIRRRLKSRCKGFLEVRELYPTVESTSRVGPELVVSEERRVQYFHRTAKDFVESEETWKKIVDATSHDSFDPDERWANASLWSLKTLHPMFLTHRKMMESVTWSIEYALRLERRRGEVLVTYLDEVNRVVGVLNPSQLNRRPGHITTFLEAAVWFQLSEYLHIKLKSLSHRQRKSLLTFLSGTNQTRPDEDRMLSGRTLLESMADQPRTHMARLLKYYTTLPPWRMLQPRPKRVLRVVK